MCYVFLNQRVMCGVEGHAMAGYTQKKETRPCSTPREDGTPCNNTNFEWAAEDIVDEKFKDICYECTNPPRRPPTEPTGPRGPRPPNHPDRPIIVPSIDISYEEPSPPRAPSVGPDENWYPANSPSPTREGEEDDEMAGYVPMSPNTLAELWGPGGPPQRRR